jgi:Rrf2 family cysteine metabolism transcriptional repressor
MKISAKEQYGLRAMVELAGRYGEGPIPLSNVSEVQGISLDYLEQVVPSLRDAGLVHSTRGAKGGYELAREPNKITIGQVLRALDGEILPLQCLTEQEQQACERSDTCGARAVWEVVHTRVLDAMDGMTLADL